MDSVGHSRLLKFLGGEKKLNKMEAPVFKIEFEFINPTNIESEVPGKQEIREGNATQDSTLDLDDKVENPNDYVLSPVITVTKQESEFTKGDLKLQKVSVTENISEEKEVINGAIYHTNSNPNIHDDVIRGPQPIRVANGNNRGSPTNPDEDIKEVKRGVITEDNKERGLIKVTNERGPKGDDSKTKTRIPTFKFKQAAQAIRERRDSSDKKDEVPPPRLMQKRSSIPRLKDSRIPPPLDRRSSRTDIKMETPQPEDEFEKIYDEIIVTEPKEIVIETIENIKVEDPEKLENKFEEIIHDYEENKVHPITDDIPIVEKPRSKIPLSKRKSEQEIKIPKPVERISVKKDESKLEKQVIESRIPMHHKDIPHKFVRSKSNIPRSNDNLSEVTSNKIVINKQISIEKPNQVDLKPRNINGDPVKVVEHEVIEVKMEESVIKEVNKPKPSHGDDSQEKPNVTVETKPELLIPPENVPIVYTVAASKLDDVVDKTKPFEHNNHHDIEKSYETVPEKENNNSKEDDNGSMDLEYKPGKVSRLLQRIRSQEFGATDLETKKEIPTDIPKKKSVLSKIAMFERQETEEAPVSRLPRSNKLPIKKLKEIKVETMQEEVIDRKPIIVDELLKGANIESTEYDLRVENSLPEQTEHKANKDYKVEIEEEAVKYVEVQVIDPVKDIKSDDIKNISPVINGIDKPIVEFTPSTPISDTRPLRSISKIESHSVSTENIAIPISRELLQPPIENLDEKVPREILIETLEYKPTEYEIEAQICLEDKPILLNQDDVLNHETNVHNVKEDIPIKSITLQETKIETLEFVPIRHSNKVENSDEVFSKESKLENRRRFNENREFKKERPKSVAEMDLGDAVKGKVHQMIERMISIEKMEKNKKEMEPRERPRKNSVSKIIALFEQRSILLESPNHKPEVTTKLPTPPQTLSEEEYQQKIAELVNGKVVYGRAENMTYIVLNNGVEMPVLAVGTALLDKRLIRPVIEAAIDMGYRAIDSAYIYGNEKEVGDAIRAKIDDGTVTREDLFIINKLWSTFHRSDLVSKACQASLRAMGLQYFDLYLIHNPVSFKEGNDPIPKIANVVQYSSSDFMDAWFGMEELVSKGLVKSIGVSNFNSRQIQRVMDKARVKPVINQVECHPYLSQDRLDEFCSASDIKLSCFGVLGSKGTPTEFKSGLPPVIDDPLVQVMAAGLNITPAQLLIRYQIDSGHHVVVKASSAAHLWDNLQSLQVSLEPSQVQALTALNRNKRMFTFVGIGDTHRNYPFKIPF